MPEMISGLPILDNVGDLFCKPHNARRLSGRSSFIRPIKVLAGEISCGSMLELTRIADTEFMLAAMTLAALLKKPVEVADHRWWVVYDPEKVYRSGVFETSFDFPDSHSLVAEVPRITPARKVFSPRKISAINTGFARYRAGPSVTRYMWSDGFHRNVSLTINTSDESERYVIHDPDPYLVNRIG